MTTEQSSERKRSPKEKTSAEVPIPDVKRSQINTYFPSQQSPKRETQTTDTTTSKEDNSSEEKEPISIINDDNFNVAGPQSHRVGDKNRPIVIPDDDNGQIKKKSYIKKKNKKSKGQKEQKKKEKDAEKREQVLENNQDIETAKHAIQSTITQHFPVRRSGRKTKSQVKKDEYDQRVKRILTADEEGLEIKVIPDKGRGVFAIRPFSRGELVCEYAGDLISIEEAKEREAEYSQSTEYGCYMYYFTYKSKKYCVDATKESSRLGRLLNHSKTSSNVHTELFPIKDTPHLILVTSRKVEVGEELLYDYGDRDKQAIESHPWLKS